VNLVNWYIQLCWLNKAVNGTIIKWINICLNGIGIVYKQKTSSCIGF
jgi:hypothetical protein